MYTEVKQKLKLPLKGLWSGWYHGVEVLCKQYQTDPTRWHCDPAHRYTITVEEDSFIKLG